MRINLLILLLTITTFASSQEQHSLNNGLIIKYLNSNTNQKKKNCQGDCETKHQL